MRADVLGGRFALCDPIARGGFSTVWRAWDLDRGQFCAAKVLRQRDAGDLLRFAREQAMRLTHGHVLTPYAWFADDQHVLIASDLAAGGSLSTLLGDWGPLHPATVADLLDQLLDALEHVHAEGIVHRDVKPANLLLDNTGTARPRMRLADFGIAVTERDARLTAVGHVIGTQGYLAPEAAAGAPPTPAQDLYAAGRVAAAMLTGTEPREDSRFSYPDGGPLATTLRALLDGRPTARPDAATARRMLGDLTREQPRTAAGDPIDVIDQLPPLPEDWTPFTGPARTKPISHGLSHYAAPTRSVTAAATGTRRRRRARYVAPAAVGVVAVAGGVAFALTRGSGPGFPPGATPSPGQVCSWVNEGDTATPVPNRTLTCTAEGDGSYTWRG